MPTNSWPISKNSAKKISDFKTSSALDPHNSTQEQNLQTNFYCKDSKLTNEKPNTSKTSSTKAKKAPKSISTMNCSQSTTNYWLSFNNTRLTIMVVQEANTERNNENKSSTWPERKNKTMMTLLQASTISTLLTLTLKSLITLIPPMSILFIWMKMENTPKYPKSHKPIENYSKWSTPICGIL